MALNYLIVDDSKLARMVVTKAVTALQPDWVRVEAGNADEAMFKFLDCSIDVALLDYNMPGKDGLTLASALRVLRPSMPIALITANIQDELTRRAVELRITFVPKPISAEGIAEFITSAAAHVATPNVKETEIEACIAELKRAHLSPDRLMERIRAMNAASIALMPFFALKPADS
jgi:DNA-binding NarL/FixJ family response regulator